VITTVSPGSLSDVNVQLITAEKVLPAVLPAAHRVTHQVLCFVGATRRA
jgi:hypothetical protein